MPTPTQIRGVCITSDGKWHDVSQQTKQTSICEWTGEYCQNETTLMCADLKGAHPVLSINDGTKPVVRRQIF